jgi:hypothetical protein
MKLTISLQFDYKALQSRRPNSLEVCNRFENTNWIEACLGTGIAVTFGADGSTSLVAQHGFVSRVAPDGIG